MRNGRRVDEPYPRDDGELILRSRVWIVPMREEESTSSCSYMPFYNARVYSLLLDGEMPCGYITVSDTVQIQHVWIILHNYPILGKYR
jgi:hypothetical protein